MDVIDTLTNTHVTALAISQSIDVAFNSTGTRAYVTSQSTSPGQVYEVNTGTYQIITTYTVGLGPTDIKMSYGNEFLIVNNNAESSVSIIDLRQNAVKTAQVGAQPDRNFVHALEKKVCFRITLSPCFSWARFRSTRSVRWRRLPYW